MSQEKDRRDAKHPEARSKETLSKEMTGITEISPGSRRSFLGWAIGLMGTTILGTLGVLFTRYTLSPALKRSAEKDEWLPVAPLDEIPPGEPVKRALVISQDGGWGRFNTQQLVWIVRDADRLTVYSAICPHLGCTINAAEGGFICPCHGSAWDLKGKRLAGPTPRGMDTLEYRLEGGWVLVKYRFFRQGVPEKEPLV